MYVVDVELNELKRLSRATGSLLMYESPTTFEFYYVQQSVIIFRTIVKKDKNAFALLQSMKSVVRILNPIQNINYSDQFENVLNKLDGIQTLLRFKI